MRLFLLPITTRQALIYCQRAAQKPTKEIGYVDRITKKAAETWANWEAAEKGWQKKVTEYGNRGLQRIPYQEWGLKSFPPLTQQVQAEELADNKKFSVFYPENIMKGEDVPKILGRLASERKNLHWKRFWWSMIGLPFALPFGLVPVSVTLLHHGDHGLCNPESLIYHSSTLHLDVGRIGEVRYLPESHGHPILTYSSVERLRPPRFPP
jgi:hypothetical protein